MGAIMENERLIDAMALFQKKATEGLDQQEDDSRELTPSQFSDLELNRFNLLKVTSAKKWEVIRNTIVNMRERIISQKIQCQENEGFIPIYRDTLQKYREIIELAEKYLIAKDKFLSTEKSRDRINFLSEQLLAQPVKSHDGVSKSRDAVPSAYFEVSSPNKIMLALMRQTRAYGKISPEKDCKTTDEIIPERHGLDLVGNIFYPLKHVIKKQPTFYSCSDTSAAMINHFQKIEIEDVLHKLNQLKKEAIQLNVTPGAAEKTAAILAKINVYIQFLNGVHGSLGSTYHAVQNKSLLSGFRSADEIKNLYNITSDIRKVDYISARVNAEGREAFIKALKTDLYEIGPVMAEINTGSPFNDHCVVINGVVDDQICYADSWNGQIKQMSVESFVKQLRSDGLSGMAGISYDLQHEINGLEENISVLHQELKQQASKDEQSPEAPRC